MRIARATAATLTLGLSLTLASPAVAVPAPAALTATRATCTTPTWSSSEPDAMWTSAPYIVHNNMWNAAAYDLSQRMDVCSAGSWSVTARVGTEDKAVKTYPNTHVDYHDWNTGAEPRLDSFASITSAFSSRTPGVGIYDQAFDIWLNGVPGDREVMVWTDNRGQVPAGRRVASGIRLSGYTWDLWATDDSSYQAFVPRTRITRGSLDLKSMLDHLVRRGSVPADATLGQICFGVEIVSTDGQDARFDLTSFSLTTTRR